MISARDFYVVMSAVVPLYVAMILAYGSVRWWRILTPEQCGGINRFVAIFAVPLLSFQILAANNPYKMNGQFVAADALQKLAILGVLAIWARYSSGGSVEWMITLFMLATLPNTLVMGIPLLEAMYGITSGDLVVQAVVLQCIIWYTLLLVFYEYRSARNLIRQQFPKTAASIVSFRVDSDVVSLDGAVDPIQADAEVGDDGKIHVTVRRSTSSRHSAMFSPCRTSKVGVTPRPSNLTGADIYSIHSSRSLTPRESSFNHSDYYSMMMIPNHPAPPSHRQSNFGASDVYSLHSSRGPTPRTSNFNHEDVSIQPRLMSFVPASTSSHVNVPLSSSNARHSNAAAPPPPAAAAAAPAPAVASNSSNNASSLTKQQADLVHMFVWSSTGSPISEGNVKMLNEDFRNKDVRVLVSDDAAAAAAAPPATSDGGVYDEFSFGHHETTTATHVDEQQSKVGSSSTAADHQHPTTTTAQQLELGGDGAEMPAMSVMTRLILDMVWRKLVRNPNTYSSLLGLGWALIAFKWNVKMPDIIHNSVLILSKAGLGMAMFSLGLFMALQKRILVCGTSMAVFGMVVRFVTGPAVMAATSIAVGLRGVNLHVSIVQAALPQGIVPFVFAKEYNVHPDVLSTAVIFGMLVAFPITMLYYVLLGL